MAKENVGTSPAQLVRAPSGSSLYQRITVSNVAATLVSLLTGAVLPTISILNRQDGAFYSFKFVDLQSETDPNTVAVRFTADGQTTPTATLGFIVSGGASITRIPADAQDIKLISTGANVSIQVYLGIGGATLGTN